jgi:membrane protein implicated in regulation of membrane protease activity
VRPLGAKGLAALRDPVLIGPMEQYTGTMVNWSLALGAFTIGGLLWAAVVFLAVAAIRVAMEIQRRKRQNAELSRQAEGRQQFMDTGFREPRPTMAVTSMTSM